MKKEDLRTFYDVRHHFCGIVLVELEADGVLGRFQGSGFYNLAAQLKQGKKRGEASPIAKS